ncbi:MAG: flagellin lysine-N-methylase [Firmicutes bacterium]|nr:flagellin lysine-N-methylase [Bacillota bacterium]
MKTDPGEALTLVAPSYYRQFKCIAQRCRHSCCRGWEIDIDPVSLERFKALGVSGISEGPDTPHFVLTEGGDCPHLRSDGLCELIIRHGEGVLCDICRDHPRFRSFWTGRVEIGLGLSCEEAARMILGQVEPMRLERIGLCDPDGVELESCVPCDAPGYGDLPEDERWLMGLRERMLGEAALYGDPMLARLAEYLIYRQLPDALYDGRLEERIEFINRGIEEIAAAWERCAGFEERCEAARSWSERNEYRV